MQAFELREKLLRPVCFLTRRHKPRVKMYVTFCQRCGKTLENSTPVKLPISMDRGEADQAFVARWYGEH